MAFQTRTVVDDRLTPSGPSAPAGATMKKVVRHSQVRRNRCVGLSTMSAVQARREVPDRTYLYR